MAAIFVTGGTGYLGSNLVAALAAAGEEVVVLRRREGTGEAGPPGVRFRPGDVRDAASLRRAMADCDRVVHAAAHVRMWDPHPESFDVVNVEGLRNVLRVSGELGIRRVVVTSSFIALGPTDGQVADENHEVPGRRFHNDYERTKTLADRVAREAAREGRVVVLYPGVVYGPGPFTAGNIVGRTVSDFLSGRLPGILGRGDRRFCYAFIGDVVRGYLEALRREVAGERFILGGENRTLVEVLTLLEELTGRPAPRRHIPYRVAEWVGRFQRWRAGWSGREPEITDEVVRIYRHEWAYSSRRAEERLGYQVTPFREGLAATLRAWPKPTT